MTKARVFFGSSTGNTERVAEMIAKELGDIVESVNNIAGATADQLGSAESLILGISTWEYGQLQEDWDIFFPKLDDIDLTGKTVALFGLGDADGFSGEFVNALGTLYEKVKERGANVTGFWPAEDYDFSQSTALVDGQFVGLVIDEDNESDLTEERVKKWVELIRPAFAES
jgi:flavodoxin I